MKRRDLLKKSVAGGALLAANPVAWGSTRSATAPSHAGGEMLAGFAREKITPPLGTRMMGFGGRDYKQGCQSIHDDLYVRALFLEHDGQQALILAYDLCFVGREEADRFKGALGREFDLLPRQILINTSHNHAGPAIGTWYWSGYLPPERLYVDQVEKATIQAVRRARERRCGVTLSAGMGDTSLPLSRRKPDGKGGIAFAPNPEGRVYTHLPVCLLKDTKGKPVCLLFSVSTHPSTVMGWDITAEYPGAACRLLDEHLGTTAAMFLQGTAGDANSSVIGRGREKWERGSWPEVEEGGRIVAQETIAALQKPMSPVIPGIRTIMTELQLPLQPVPPRGEFEAVVKEVKPEDCPRNVRCLWASRQLAHLDRGEPLPESAGILLQEICLGRGLRLVGIEGEPVAVWGWMIEDLFHRDVTFPLGYCNGQGLYLPVSAMIPEGGYEVASYWEYGYPSPLATGMESLVMSALVRLHRRETG